MEYDFSLGLKAAALAEESWKSLTEHMVTVFGGVVMIQCANMEQLTITREMIEKATTTYDISRVVDTATGTWTLTIKRKEPA